MSSRDSRWSIKASFDAEVATSVLAVFVACHEQSVIRDELCLAKRYVASVGRRATRYGYGPHGWGDIAPRRRVDGVAVRRPLRDKDRRPLSPNVALAVVGQKTEIWQMNHRLLSLARWVLGGVYQRQLRRRKGECGELI